MSAPADIAISRPWYREFWPWLLMIPPLFAVIGGVTMIWLAVGTPNALVVDDYARIEELTDERFARDRQALQLGLSAVLRVDQGSGLVELSLASPSFRAGAELVLSLRHIVDPAADTEIILRQAGDSFVGQLNLVPGRYHVELLPPDRSWRLGTGPALLGGELQLGPQRDDR